jgi:hypothetical protein
VSALSITPISLNDYLTQSLAYLRQPITTLESQRSDLGVKSAVFADLKEKLTALEDVLERMATSGTSSTFRQKAVTSSGEHLVTATRSLRP